MKLSETGRNKFVVKQKAYILTQMSCKPVILYSKSSLAIFPLLYKAALTSLIFRVLVVCIYGALRLSWWKQCGSL